jgi:hypothetical protein
MMPNLKAKYCMHEDEYTWSEYDARGIYLCLVCDKCVDAKLKEYRSDVLVDSNYWADEPVEEF